MAAVAISPASSTDANIVSGKTELMAACELGDASELLRVLTTAYNNANTTNNNDSDVDARDARGRTAAMYAASAGNATAFKVLRRGPSLLNIADHDGGTPAMSCAVHGHAHALVELIERGADVSANVVDNDGWTAMHYACCKGEPAIVKMLLDSNESNTGVTAMLQARNNDGKTPLDLAKENNNDECLRAIRVHVEEMQRK